MNGKKQQQQHIIPPPPPTLMDKKHNNKKINKLRGQREDRLLRWRMTKVFLNATEEFHPGGSSRRGRLSRSQAIVHLEAQSIPPPLEFVGPLRQPWGRKRERTRRGKGRGVRLHLKFRYFGWLSGRKFVGRYPLIAL